MKMFTHLLLSAIFVSSLNSMDYTNRPEVKKFMSTMQYKYGFKKKTLIKWFKNVRKNSYIRRLRRGLYCYSGRCKSMGIGIDTLINI